MPRSKIWLYVFILIAATISIYAHTARYGFIGWDDDKDVLNKPRIQQLTASSVMHLFNPSGIFEGQYYYEYFPVTDLSYMIEWHFYGKDFPQGFHMDNVLLQTINVVLVFIAVLIFLRKQEYSSKVVCPPPAEILRRVRNDKVHYSPPQNATIAFFVALLFAVHPLMVENVTWISGRKDLLLMMFYLLWFVFYMRSGSKSIPAFVCFILALLSKFQAVTIPGVLAAYELLINRSDIKTTAKKLIPSIIILLIYVPYTMWYYHKGATAFVDYGGLLWTMLFLPEAVFIYFRKLLLPFDLTPVYTTPSFPDTGLLVVSMIFFVVLFVWMVTLFKNKKFSSLFGFAWFFANFVPISNVIPLPTKIADRYMYEAALGMFLIAALWTADVYSHSDRKRELAVVYASLFIVLAFLSYRQSLHWKNSFALWNYTIQLQPRSAVARNNLGVYYKDHSDIKRATHEFERALSADKKFVPALWNLGIIYLNKGNYDGALSLFMRMSEVKAPEQYMAFRALGALYLVFYNNPAQAKKYFEQSYLLNPHQADADTLKTIIGNLSKPDKP